MRDLAAAVSGDKCFGVLLLSCLYSLSARGVRGKPRRIQPLILAKQFCFGPANPPDGSPSFFYRA